MAGTNMVNHFHSLTADTTDNQTLQQRGAFTRRTLATLWAEGMSIFLQPSLILLVFIPGDVTDMRAEQQRVPFVFRYAVLLCSLQCPAYACAPIDEGPCVARVMQYVQHLSNGQFYPE